MLGTGIVVRDNDASHVVAIDNLSVGGALVSAEERVEPGTWVHILLCLPGSAAATLLALVLRCEPHGEGAWQIALKFDHVAPVVEEWLRSRVAQVLERQYAASAEAHRGLVVGPSNAAREAMVGAIRGLGFSVLAVDTVPEAVVFLGHQPAPFDFVAVDAVSECAEGVDLLAMAHRIYPDMRCILIGDAADRDYLEREGKFLERGELLLRPWTDADLRRALARGTGD